MGFEGSPVHLWYESAPRDVAGMKRALHPDVTFSVCEGWPNGGIYHGREAVLGDFFPGASKAWERIKPEMDEVIEAGDTWIVRGRYVGVASETRTPFSVEFVHIWKVEDGQLISMRQIADTAVLTAARAGSPALSR